ncbi:hypothetical protein CHS0354_003256 [Potamilus streckersoni]|uniref:Protein kinase domain-containing protein n=1 Tax=Potamilus streckersoni TaxID=2493646 RepID=A0AAE0SVU1_9BIVA|nr:hypothetical protein CHS0354_003256 [Potamilus streckersoni]
MENSAQETSDSSQEASDKAHQVSDSGGQEKEEAVNTEMSALSITGVYAFSGSSEDKSLSGPVQCEDQDNMLYEGVYAFSGSSEDKSMSGPVQCVDQENMLYEELDVHMPQIIDGIVIGEMILLHRNFNGNLDCTGLRSLNCDVSFANTVVESDDKENLNAVFTHIRILKACKFPKGVVSNSSKLGPDRGEYREKFEYNIQAHLGEGICGTVTRIFDTKKSTTCARKRIPISDFREDEVLALIDLKGTGVSPDYYGLLIAGNYVYIFMEEITNSIPLSRLIQRFQKSEYRSQIVPHLLYNLLVALFEIHSKWWLHNDLHEDNIVMQIEPDVSMHIRILDFGDASYTEEELDFRKEYENIGKMCKNILTSISDEESELDKSARREIQFLMKKVSDITEFRLLTRKRYANVQLPRDVEKALQKICLDAAGFKATNSNKDCTSNFNAYMKYSTSGGSTALEDEENRLSSPNLHTSTKQIQPPKIASIPTENFSISMDTRRKVKETWENDTLDKHVSKTLSEPLTEQEIFKWLNEHPHSLKKYLANREINSIQESSLQDSDMVMFQGHEMLGMVEQQKRPIFPGISSYDSYTDSKAFMTTSVRGSIHQASTHIFKHDAAGSQCTTICAIAVAVAAFKLPSEWRQDHVDMIIQYGDKVHVCELEKRGWPVKRKESKLDVDELPKKVEFYLERKTAYIVTDHTSYGLISQIEFLVKEAVNKKPEKSFILRMLDRCRAILYNGCGCYSVFDPHSCDELGRTDPNGVACVLHFDHIDELVSHLKNLVTDQDNEEQVDLTTCNITIQVSGSR